MQRKHISLFLLFCFFSAVVAFSGCTVTFAESDTLQLSLSKPTETAMSLVAEFEAGEAENVAGDVTQKSGSVCSGGACLIY